MKYNEAYLKLIPGEMLVCSGCGRLISGKKVKVIITDKKEIEKVYCSRCDEKH